MEVALGRRDVAVAHHPLDVDRVGAPATEALLDGSDQYSQVEVTSTQLSGGQWVGPTVRSQNSGQDTYLGIYFWECAG